MCHQPQPQAAEFRVLDSTTRAPADKILRQIIKTCLTWSTNACIYMHAIHGEILHQLIGRRLLLTLNKAKSIFNLQSIILYDILCIWISTYTYHYFRNLIAYIIVRCCPILVVRISSGVISNPTSCCSSAAGSRGHLIWIS